MSTVSPPSSATDEKAPHGSTGHASLTFLKAKQLWRPSASSAVRDAWKADDHAAAWDAWAAYLAKRKTPAVVPPAPSGKRPSMLAWGLSAPQGEAFSDWLAGACLAKAKAAATAANRWTADAANREADLPFALEAVAWATHLPSLATNLGADAWWSLTEALVRTVEEASATAAPDPSDAEGTVVEQLLVGELPLLLSRLLPEMLPLHSLAEASRKSLSQGVERLTDGEGLLTATLWADPNVPAASLLLACWTRCRTLVGDGKAPWSGDAQAQYEWLVRQALRLSDRHGRLAFSAAGGFGALEMLKEALRHSADESDDAAAALRLKGFRADDSFETPEPSNHSEWSEIGVLSAGWRDKAPRIVVAHPADTMRVEIHCGKHVLLAGDWPVEASIDGEPVRSSDDWECQCWYSDEDGDYLELALPLAGEARLERQFFVSREDGVGFLAETIFTGRADDADIAITTRLPLGEGLGLRPEKETREALLTGGGETLAGLVPLALPEWRDDPRGGELTAEDRRLVLTRQWRGRNAASPLWIDFSAKRFEKQRTWRQLAVAESLKNVSPDVAIGYRVQAAKQQWLIYRSLDKPGNRTLLGQNFSSEMFVGKFKAPGGTTDEYFEIEGEES